MAISLKRYVDITSGVGAASAVSVRQLIARLFTTNPLLPTGTFAEFNSADEVGAYFGTTSAEYLRALFYFGWVSKITTNPKKISFARWSDVDTAPQIFGAAGTQAIATWNAITAGAFSLTLGGTTNLISGLNFSAAPNLAGVASIIQTAIRTKTGTMWTAATVTYDAVRGSFNFTGGATGVANVAVIAGGGGADIAGQLGWLSPTATILSFGSLAQSVTTVLTQSTDASNNFGSFTFIPTLTQSQIVEAATWNLAKNNMFMYSVRCDSSNAATLRAALQNIGGNTLTLSPIATEYPEMVPMMILAATNYESRRATQNYMYQLFNLTPSVTTDTDANTYDALNVNYYGQTQQAGNLVQFYQRGLMNGLPVDPADQNTYANEQWLKDAAAASILTLLLALPKVSANSTGRAQLLTIIQGVINRALANGVISVGKTLTDTQKLFISDQTGDENAWYQVQNIGYWIDCQIVAYAEAGVTKYKAVYTLIYSKDDVIRKVEGRDILI